VPDEVAHVAYAQSLGETGKPPSQPRAIMVSPEEATAMAHSRFGDGHARTLRAAVWARSQQRQLVVDGQVPSSRRAAIEMGGKEPEPPLYYALESIAYRAASGAPLIDRIAVMRLLSALLAGATALLCFLFVRECLPGRPWAWTVGGLGVAFVPMLGFISGGVNPDALLYALSAGLFLCVARAWRRGLTPRLAAAAGALIAAGLLTKVNFLGLVPGAVLGIVLAARRTTLAWDRRLLGLVGATVAVAGVLVALGVAFETVVWERPFAVGRPAAPESHVDLWAHVSYVWQVFLPRLPFQPPTTLTDPGYEQLFKSFVGAFGWMVVWLPAWGYRIAAIAALLLVVLAVRALAVDSRELRWRRRELLGYAAMAGVLMLLIGLSADLRRDILHTVQGRYLLPLLPLFGVLLALGARGAGDRWGRAFGVAIVAGVVAWSLFGQLVTIAWFYS
jgi:4-amino-4-deoxy-L-arabinose transferase-like glycosyltransferase